MKDEIQMNGCTNERLRNLMPDRHQSSICYINITDMSNLNVELA